MCGRCTWAGNGRAAIGAFTCRRCKSVHVSSVIGAFPCRRCRSAHANITCRMCKSVCSAPFCSLLAAGLFPFVYTTPPYMLQCESFEFTESLTDSPAKLSSYFHSVPSPPGFEATSTRVECRVAWIDSQPARHYRIPSAHPAHPTHHVFHYHQARSAGRYHHHHGQGAHRPPLVRLRP